jgi:hypothetical protein
LIFAYATLLIALIAYDASDATPLMQARAATPLLLPIISLRERHLFFMLFRYGAIDADIYAFASAREPCATRRAERYARALSMPCDALLTLRYCCHAADVAADFSLPLFSPRCRHAAFTLPPLPPCHFSFD